MLRPPSHAGLHHVALFVHNLEETVSFYVDLLGFKIEWQPDPDNVYLCSGNDNLALHRSEHPVGFQKLDHIGVVVKEASHVLLWEQFLMAHQVPVVAATKKHRDGATSCYVRDPSGTVVQIIHHPPIAAVL
jgi:catechol 2,3-dioxygenase-like lactoylglutathione lyase family enzyme